MKLTVEIEAADIPAMQEMSAEGYRNYIDSELFFVDHHGVLRSAQGQYPIATSREQYRELLRYLREEFEPRIER